MRRAPDPGVETCEHGYEVEAARRDCARCADRPIPAPKIETRFPQTRWHATDTTLGPRVKVAITAVLVVPLLFMLYALHLAYHRPMLTVLIVPLGGLLIFDLQFLPELWAPGGRSVRDFPR